MTLDSSHIQNSHLGLGRSKPKFPGEDLIGSEGIRCHPGQHTYNLLGRITESDMNMATGTYLGCVWGGRGVIVSRTSASEDICSVFKVPGGAGRWAKCQPSMQTAPGERGPGTVT